MATPEVLFPVVDRVGNPRLGSHSFSLLIWFGSFRGRSDRGSGQGDSLYPVGYLDKQVPDTSVQETDRILVEKVQRY